MDDWQIEKWDKPYKEKFKLYLEEVVKPLFPSIDHFEGESWNSGYFGGQVDIPTYNSYFKDIGYYYTESNSFIHYTSLRNCINILNDGHVKAFDLNFQDDPMELIHAGKFLNKVGTKDDLNLFKSLAFSFSFCEFDENSNTDNFDLWRLYGENGLGAAIVFKFRGDTESWKNEFISRVYYDDKTKQAAIEQFSNRHIEFYKKYNFEIRNIQHEEGHSLPYWITIPLSFHKNSIYKIENEIRLLILDNPYNHKYIHQKGYVFNLRNNICSYKSIPILSQKNLGNIALKYDHPLLQGKNICNINPHDIDTICSRGPVIEIEKIILGFRYNFDTFNRLKKEFIDKSNFVSNYNFKIELSKHSSAFH